MAWKEIKSGFSHFMVWGNFLGAVLGYAAVASLVIGFLARQSKPFTDAGYGLADAALIGLAGAVLLALVGAIAFLMVATAYRILRPNRSRPATETLPPTTAENAVGQIEAANHALAGVHAELEGLRAFVAKAEERSGAIEGSVSSLTDHVDQLGTKIRSLEQHKEAATDSTEQTLWALRSIGYRERLISRTKLIEDCVEKLTLEGNDFLTVDWPQWIELEESWRRHLYEWIDLATPYGNNVSHRVLNTPPDSYLGKWSFDESLIPIHANAHRYKTFCLINRNWEAQLAAVMAENFRQAYGS